MAALSEKFIVGPENDPLYTFEDDQVMPTTSSEVSVSLPGEEFPYDTLTFHIRSDTPITIPYGTEIAYYVDDNLIGRFYKKEMKRADKIYDITAMSIVGMLDRQYHAGGIYNGYTFLGVLNDMFGNGESILPAGYFKLDYIGPVRNYPSVSAYGSIDTDVQITPTGKVVVEFEIVGSGETKTGTETRIITQFIGQTRIALHKPYINFFTYKPVNISQIGYWGYDIQNSYSGIRNPQYIATQITENIRQTITVDLKNNKMGINGVLKDITSDLIDTLSENYYSLYYYYPDNKYKVYGCKIYGCKIYDNNVLVGDFVPCVNLKTAKYGLYNLVTNHFCPTYLNGEKYADVGNFIVGTGAVKAIVDSDVAMTKVYGWLPYASKRENIYKLMAAFNVNLLKDNNGISHFAFLRREYTSIPNSRLIIGGSEDDPVESTIVDVTAHTFIDNETVEEIKLYDTEDSGDVVRHKLIKFDQPIILSTLRADGLNIEESGVNYVVVSGNGKLTGIPYTHIQNVHRKATGNTGEEQSITISDDTLISEMNVSYVINRLINYYGYSKKVVGKLYYDGEKCGNEYQFTGPYGEIINAYLEKMSLSITSLIGADCEFAADYEPIGYGNLYEHVVVLTGTGNWTIPASVFEKDLPYVKAILISGGQGGETALKGGDGEVVNDYDKVAKGGIGGEKGKGGHAGRILNTGDIDVTGLTTIHYSCGSGGSAQYDSTGLTHIPGNLGGDTTFLDFTTQGEPESRTGLYIDLLDTYYAIPGEEGISGSAGTDGDQNLRSEDVIFNGTIYSGASTGTNVKWKDSSILDYHEVQGSEYAEVVSGASGAQVGNNALVGSYGYIFVVSEGLDGETYILRKAHYRRYVGGHITNHAMNRSESISYGSGGHGAHGGAGGGGSEMIYSGWTNNLQDSFRIYDVEPAPGSMPGYPLDGAPGCVIVYY